MRIVSTQMHRMLSELDILKTSRNAAGRPSIGIASEQDDLLDVVVLPVISEGPQQ